MNEARATTPESIPSVGVTSPTSSSDNDDVARELFPEEAGEQVQGKVVQPGSCKSEVSVASSDETVVASWNLSPSDSGGTLNDDEESVNVGFAEDAFKETDSEPIFMEEAPEEDTSSCNGALRLTPSQVAEIFLVFESARNMWPSSRKEKSSTEEATTLTSKALSWVAANNGGKPECVHTAVENKWKQTAEKLDRECQALKEIIRVDSQHLFKLKSELETKRNLPINL